MSLSCYYHFCQYVWLGLNAHSVHQKSLDMLSGASSFTNQYTPNLGMLINIYNYNWYRLSSVSEVVQYMKSFFLRAKTHLTYCNLQTMHLANTITTTIDL